MPAMNSLYEKHLSDSFADFKSKTIPGLPVYQSHAVVGQPFLPGPQDDASYLRQLAESHHNGGAFSEAVRVALAGQRFDSIIELNLLMKIDIVRKKLCALLLAELPAPACIQANEIGVEKLIICTDTT